MYTCTYLGELPRLQTLCPMWGSPNTACSPGWLTLARAGSFLLPGLSSRTAAFCKRSVADSRMWPTWCWSEFVPGKHSFLVLVCFPHGEMVFPSGHFSNGISLPATQRKTNDMSVLFGRHLNTNIGHRFIPKFFKNIAEFESVYYSLKARCNNTHINLSFKNDLKLSFSHLPSKRSPENGIQTLPRPMRAAIPKGFPPTHSHSFCLPFLIFSILCLLQKIILYV